MHFTNPPFRRFSVCCPTTYRVGLREGYDMIWNLSVNGWRLSGNVPLRVVQTCPLTVHLPNQESLVVAAAIVRWAQVRSTDWKPWWLTVRHRAGWKNLFNTSNKSP